MKNSFPKNPEDKTIFEASSGCFYIYCKSDNSWNRLPGVNQLGLATEQKDGLLSSEDYKKLNGLILPPPQTSIKGEQCQFSYDSGKIGLYNSDDFINIKGSLTTYVNNAQQENNWSLHQNTQGIDFTIDVEKLFEELEERGKIKKVSLEGLQGFKGDDGEPGIDRLNTGPVGKQGEPGVNAPFAGTITPEAVQFERIDPNSNKAVVDITTEEVSEEENYLVVKRANIGSVDASPNKVVFDEDLKSDWVAVVDIDPTSTQKVIENASCTDKIICRATQSSVHYLNMSTIAEAFRNRFLQQLQNLKEEKESVIYEFLNSMITMFSSQKSAICCALENCRSRKRNANDRRYIEQQRIQAAQAGYNLEVDGEPKEIIDMNTEKNCVVSTPGESTVEFGDPNDCTDCVARVTVDGRVSTGKEENAVVFDLDPGEYIVTIEECCINESLVKDRYNGQLTIKYRREKLTTSGGPIRDAEVSFPECGVFDNAADAENAYIGLTLQLSHAGGQIKVWAPDPYPQDNDGIIEICFRRIECFEESFGTDEQETDDTIFVYKNQIGEDSLIGSILPFIGPEDAVTNYGYQAGSDSDGPNISIGCNPASNESAFFFYDGSDGLSFFTLNGNIGINNNIVNYSYNIINNNTGADVLLSDDPGELVETTPNEFNGNWNQDGDGDGGIIGYFDRRDDAPWIMELEPTNPGSIDILKVCSRDGDHLYVPAPVGTILTPGFSVRGTQGFPDRIQIANFEAGDGLKLMINGAVSIGQPFRTRGSRNASTVLSNRLTVSADGFYVNDGVNIARTTLAGILSTLISRKFNLRGQGNTFGLMLRIEYDDGEVEEFLPYTSTRFRTGWSWMSRMDIRTGFERAVGALAQGDPTLIQRHRATFPTSPICDPDAYANSSGAGGWATSNPTNFAGEPSIEKYCERFIVSYLRFKKPGKLYAFMNGGGNPIQVDFLGQYDIMVDKCPASKFDAALNPVPDLDRFGNTLNFASTPPFCEGDGAGNEVDKLIFTKIRDGCLMPWQKIEWYERGWRTGACCGAYVEFNGQKWLVVKRSIGIDTTCGGGENEDEECIRTFINRFGHPAIAWPSFDGDEFFGRPTSGSVTFINDQNLSSGILAKLSSGDVIDSKGDLNNIPLVLFPRID